jgi:hypothetical protein
LQEDFALPEKERERTVAEIADVKIRLAELQVERTAGGMTGQRADFATAQGNEELRRLTARLADLDASISIEPATPKTARGR